MYFHVYAYGALDFHYLPNYIVKYKYLWVTYLFVMNRHFVPKPYREKERKNHKTLTTKTPKQEFPPYRVCCYRIKTWKPIKKTDEKYLFYVIFTVDHDPQMVYDSLCTEFGDNVAIICKWVNWYEVLMKDALPWGEIRSGVDMAFKGKLPIRNESSLCT